MTEQADATQQAGASESEQTPIKRPPLPRDQYADHIIKQRRADRDAALKEEGIEVIDTTDVGHITGLSEDEAKEAQRAADEAEAGTPGESEGKPQASQEGEKESETTQQATTTEIPPRPAEETATPAADEAIAAASTDEELITIKVDGQEQHVPKSKIEEAGIRTLQKESAADKRLQRATEILREAETTAANFVSDKGSPGAGDPGQQDDLSVSAEEVTEVVQAIQDGTKEQGVKAFTNLVQKLGGRQEATPDVTQLTNVVKSRLDFESAFSDFKKDNKHIADNPMLMNEAYRLDEELMQEEQEQGIQRSYSERYAVIAERINDGLKTMGVNVPDPSTATSTTETPGDKRQKRAEKKQASDQTPTPAGGRAGGTPDAGDQPAPRKSPRTIIAGMRAARGQNY